MQPIYIGYDERLLSATLNSLGFDPLSNGLAFMPRSDAAFGIFESDGNFGVAPEARPIAFVLLMAVTSFRQLPKKQMADLRTRLNALASRWSLDLGSHHFGSAPPDDHALLIGQWGKIRDLVHDAYGDTDIREIIATRKELFLHPWSLTDFEFYAAWTVVFAGNDMGAMPSKPEWDKNIDSATAVIRAAASDIMIVTDGATAGVNAAVPIPARVRRLGRVVNRLNTVDDVMHAVAPSADKLASAFQQQAKDSYQFFKENLSKKLRNAYRRDFYRRKYIHDNITKRGGGRFPRAATMIVPAQIMKGLPNDEVSADPVRQNPAWAIEPRLGLPNEP